MVDLCKIRTPTPPYHKEIYTNKKGRKISPPCFEPIPRFELGTPSLRVKCSTAELNRQRFLAFCECKYRKIYLFSQIFGKKLQKTINFL